LKNDKESYQDTPHERASECIRTCNLSSYQDSKFQWGSFAKFPGGGGVLPYMGYIGMCRREEYGFQAVYSRIGYINQDLWI